MTDITLSHRLFDQAVEDNTWTTLVAEAVDIIETDNQNFWRRGDLCLRVDRSYGEGSIKKFAAETGLGAAKSLYEAAQISRFFPPPVRSQVPTLKREHFRRAYRTVSKAERKLTKPLDAVMRYLKQAEDNGWSAAKMAREMLPDFGQKTKDVWSIEPCDEHFTGGYAVLILDEAQQKKYQEALTFKGKPTFKVTLRISVEHEPES